ncbi:hypothetical protein MMC34_005654 [Xylographa carneopallida]|nr:hypothetical protein [Xylographa carneopallida]
MEEGIEEGKMVGERGMRSRLTHARHILQTAPELSPAYVRALATLTEGDEDAPPQRSVTEEGFEDHCRPPSYDDIWGDRTVNPWKWTTDSTEPDTPGRRRRLGSGDWEAMRRGAEGGEESSSTRVPSREPVSEAVEPTLDRAQVTLMGIRRRALSGQDREASAAMERWRREESERVNRPFAAIGRGRA